jgi:hypothetical protein
VYGTLTATLASGMFSTMAAPLVGLEGIIFAGISGKRASVLGLVDAELAAAHGTVEIKGGKAVKIECDHGDAHIGAGKHAFVRADDTASLHGKLKAYVGAGEGKAFGLKATGTEVVMGWMASADNLEGASLDASCALSINESEISLRHHDAVVLMRDDTVRVASKSGAGEVIIDGSQVKIDGPKIYLA